MKYLILFCLIWGTTAGRAQTTLKLPLKAVTLYLNGAELRHESSLSLPAGTAEIRLSGLSPYLLRPSIQTEISGAEMEGLDFVSVQPQADAAPVTLRDSLRVAQASLQNLQAEAISIAAQRDFFEQNKKLERITPGRWAQETQQAATYYATTLADLTKRDLQVKERLGTQTQQVASLTQRAGLAPAATTGNTEVRLRLLLAKAGVVRVSLIYQLRGSGAGYTSWNPKYELRVSDGKLNELQVVSRAELNNNSGLAWAGLPVILRNTTPGYDVSRPSLDPWGVSFSRAGNEGEGRLDNFVVKGTGSDGATAKGSTDALELGDRLRLPEPVTLATGAGRTFRLAEQTLPMRLEYLAIPKRDENVFLVGKVAGWSKVGFQGESAEVFFRGSYVGTTEVDTRAYADSLEVSLGRDPQVQLTRTKREDFESPTNGGSRERTKLVYEITVKNTHPYPVSLRLLDQIPVSQAKDITVKVQDIGGASLDAASGKLTWLFTLAPGANRRFPVAFTVEAPAEEEINLRRNRRISSPKYR